MRVFKPFIIIVLSIVFATLLQVVLPMPGLSSNAMAAAAEEGEKKKRAKLSQRRFYTLEPFTVPMMTKGAINEQFTIVIGIEIAHEENRADIAHSVPRIRNEVYNELLHLVTFRRRGSSIPQISVLKSQLFMVTQKVMGDKVKGVVIQQAFKGPTK